MPHIDPPKPLPNWIKHRNDEIARFDAPLGDGVLQQQIHVTENFLQSKDNAKVKHFNMPPFARIILTDKVAYYTPYRSDAHGRHSPVIKYGRGHMYDSFRRLFDHLWQQEPQDFSQSIFTDGAKSKNTLLGDS